MPEARDMKPTDLLSVRGAGVSFHVLKSGDCLTLIDSGFLGGVRRLQYALSRAGWSGLPIRHLLLTHGHLDHTLNAAAIQADSGCKVWIHPADQSHIEGKHIYQDAARVCGALERIGRRWFHYAPPRVDGWLDDNLILPVWAGLRTVHLPGHTDGHCGFYCESRGLLFSGDLFVGVPVVSHPPPRILSTRPELLPASIAKALTLDPAGVIPNHRDAASPARQLARLQTIARRLGMSHAE